MPKYKLLAEKIISDIQGKRIIAGDKMLSLRQFAKQHHVSISTAISCYEELEKEGWIIARPQSGFIITAKPLLIAPPSWTSFITEATAAKKSDKNNEVTVGPLGKACLELSNTTKSALNKSLRKALNQTNALLHEYPNSQGEPIVRQTLASHFSQTGFAMHENELVITHGCIDAVKTALSICTHSGNTVAVNSPCYNGLLDQLYLLGLKLIEIPSTSDGIDLNELERLFKTGQVQAGLFCCTHMNPQGITMSVKQKKCLSQLASDYQIPVIEDDVYFELSHTDTYHLPTAYFDDNGYVIWCGSISKTLSPSFRFGWCRPGRYLSQYQQQFHGVPTIIQLAIADFIQSGAYSRHLKQAKYQLAKNKQNYIHYLSERLPEGSCITQPDGGLVLWIQVPGLDTTKLNNAATVDNLDIRTGNLFTESQRYLDCLRINIGYAFNHEIQTTLDHLLDLIDNSCPNDN